jgi:hypothetical protein
LACIGTSPSFLRLKSVCRYGVPLAGRVPGRRPGILKSWLDPGAGVAEGRPRGEVGDSLFDLKVCFRPQADIQTTTMNQQ